MKNINKKRVGLGTTIMLMVLTFTLTLVGLYAVITTTYNQKMSTLAERNDAVAKLDQINAIIERKYLNPDGETKIDYEKMQDYGFYGYVAGLGDKYSTYLSAEEFAQHTESTAGRFTGIGVTAVKDEGSERIKVMEVYENSPALAAGIQAGDFIVAVDGVSVEEKGYSESIDGIIGVEGVPVTLSVERDGEDLEFTIVRSIISVNPISYKMLEGNIGYIRIKDFNEKTAEGFEAALFDISVQAGDEGLLGIIFDLRNNTGGTLDSIVSVLDTMLPEGEIVKLVNKDGVSKVYKSDKNELDVPMAVVVNGVTASASELFTGSLRDYDKAKIIGTTTYGKGCAVGIYSLKDGSGLSIVDEMYYTASGANFEGKGIEPDYVVDMPDELLKNMFYMGVNEDPQISAAYAVLTDDKIVTEDTLAAG